MAKTVESIVDGIFKLVRETGTYVERNHKTIGGMWTVDTWERKFFELLDVRVQLMDEGYTRCIICLPELHVMDFGGKITFYTGDETELRNLWTTLTGEPA